MQVCSDNETPFTLPEPITDVTPEQQRHSHPQQQQQQVLESRNQPDCPAAPIQTSVTRQPVTSSRLSAVKVSRHFHREIARFFVKFRNSVTVNA